MANQRKLGRTADQRKALLRNQVTNLIWNGRITTTVSKAKDRGRNRMPSPCRSFGNSKNPQNSDDEENEPPPISSESESHSVVV